MANQSTSNKRAMSSADASEKKLSGHINEKHFAALIGGQVNKGSQAAKKDVIDKNHRSHSVKAGTWWQIFLYGKDRLIKNTIFQGLGDIADIMIACIDSYPAKYDDYQKNKTKAKRKLQPNMRRLLQELQKPKMLPSLLDKGLFDAGNVDFLSMHIGPSKDPKGKKKFHVFHKDDVVKAIAADVTLRNSKALKSGDMDDLKVTLLSTLHGKNIGEIEDRHDSATHYREIKFRLKAELVYDILNNYIMDNYETGKSTGTPFPQVTTYGKAVRLLK